MQAHHPLILPTLTFRSASALLVLTLGVGACKKESPTSITPGKLGIPAAMLIVSGDSQADTVGEQLPSPLVVQVLDSSGHVVAGQLVNYRVTSGGGSMFAGSGITNDSGITKDYWTLGTSIADSQSVEARAVDPKTGAKLTFAVFRAIPLPSEPDSIIGLAGNLQVGAAGSVLAESLSVKVIDRFGNGVAGVPVTWQSLAGAGSVSASSATTSGLGVARAAWTLGPRLDSIQVASASSGSLPPVTFSATPEMPASAMISAAGGDTQTGVVGGLLPVDLAVQVKLANSTPVQGARVVWSVRSGGGIVIPFESLTDTLGQSRAALRLGTVTGVDSVSATVNGIGSVTFVSTARAGPPASILLVSGYDQTALAGETLPESLDVEVEDQYGNPVPYSTVTWVASPGGGFSPSSASTDSFGRAASLWTLGFAASGTDSSLVVTGAITATAHARLAIPIAGIAADQQGSGACAISALIAGGALYCWGRSVVGVIATPGGISNVPVQVGSGVVFTQIAAGSGPDRGCALTQTGKAYCWGANADGQVGDSTTTDRAVPTPVSGGLTYRLLVVGYRQSCGVAADGSAYCWGYGGVGRCGVTAISNGDPCSTTPAGGNNGPWIAYSLGFDLDCGLSPTGYPKCGVPLNTWGQAGPTAGFDSSFILTAIAAGLTHACGINSAGGVYCWGNNQYGELGIGTSDQQAHSTPLPVLGSQAFAQLSSGSYQNTCALTTLGAPYCWGGGFGFNPYGPTPAAVGGGVTFSSIALGNISACGLTARGAVYCWGNNYQGNVGDGTFVNRALPTRVVGP